MKKHIMLIGVVLVLVLAVAGCAPKATAPAEQPSETSSLTAKDVPELQDLVTKGCLDGDLPINPYESLAVKADGTPFTFAHTIVYMGAEWCVAGTGVIESLIESVFRKRLISRGLPLICFAVVIR